MRKGGALIPDSGTGIEIPGPDFRLQFKMANGLWIELLVQIDARHRLCRWRF